MDTPTFRPEGAEEFRAPKDKKKLPQWSNVMERDGKSFVLVPPVEGQRGGRLGTWVEFDPNDAIEGPSGEHRVFIKEGDKPDKAGRWVKLEILS